MLTKPHFDDLETRSADTRAAALAEALPVQIARAQKLPGYAGALADIEKTGFLLWLAVGVTPPARVIIFRAGLAPERKVVKRCL